MKNKKSSNRSFGILFFVVFLILGLWPLFKSQNPSIFLLCISGVFLILGFLNSKLLSPLYVIWMKFADILAKIIPPVVMFSIFFIIVTPIGFFLKLIGKDIVNLKFDKKKKSYWIKRANIKSMKRQF